MSASTQATPDVATLDGQLNDQIAKGDILGAFDRFYAENVTMQENSDEPFAGKANNRKREEEFIASVQEFPLANGSSTPPTKAARVSSWPKWRCGVGRTARSSKNASITTRAEPHIPNSRP
jgi:hypothetical protein